ncbi:hypothetical protein CR513_11264, partial [Mucuna pruriens]
MNLFNPYATSYKGFKNRFVKVLPVKDAPFAMDEQPIPLYWRFPNKVKRLSMGQLSSDDRANWILLNQLPRGVSCWEGYDLGALIKKSGDVAKGKLEKAKADAAKAKAISTAPSSATTPKDAPKPKQTKLILKLVLPLSTLTEVANAKRKVAPSTKEANQKKGKTMEGSSSQLTPTPVATSTPSFGVIMSTRPTVGSLEFPQGGLANFVASPRVSSLWNSQLDTANLLKSVEVSTYDQKLLLSTSTESSLKSMVAYYARTMAIAKVLKPVIRKSKQLV